MKCCSVSVPCCCCKLAVIHSSFTFIMRYNWHYSQIRAYSLSYDFVNVNTIICMQISPKQFVLASMLLLLVVFSLFRSQSAFVNINLPGKSLWNCEIHQKHATFTLYYVCQLVHPNLHNESFNLISLPSCAWQMRLTYAKWANFGFLINNLYLTM